MSDDDPIETRLRAALHGATDRVTVQPDALDVHRRAAHRRRRRLVATSGIAAAAVIIVGAIAWPGRNNGPVHVVPATPTTGRSATTTTPVNERTTTGGWTVRTSVGPFTLRSEFDRGLPAVCSPDHQLDITFWVPGTTGDADAIRTAAPLPTASVPSVGVYSSYLRADPGLNPGTVPYLFMMAVATDLPFDSVRASFGDGTSDEAPLVDGTAVLISVAPGTQSAEMTNPAYALVGFELLAADGSSLALSATPPNTAPNGLYDATGQRIPSVADEAGSRGECERAPTPLPPAGDPPADAVAAEAAVRAAIATAFDGSRSADERATAFVDPALAPAVVAEVTAAYPDPSTRGVARVTEVSFTSPSTASVRWDVQLGVPLEGQSMGEGSVYNSLIGEVILVDGSWKVTAPTVCTAARKLAPEACAGIG